MGSSAAEKTEFAPTVIRGLLEFGPFDTELGLELGLSLWLHTSATTPSDAREAMLELRSVILQVSAIDPRSEPFPLIGRSAEKDVVNLATYLGQLVQRAAVSSGLDAETVVELAIARL
jgi:hypothetical protein